MAEFFSRNIILVYFLYGLSFFSMGLSVMLEAGRTSKLNFAQALRPLAGFGLVHGSHEWLEMFLLIHSPTPDDPNILWIGAFRIGLLTASFLMLVAFGVRLIFGPAKQLQKRNLLLIIILIWAIGLLWVWNTQGKTDRLIAMDVYTRYALAIPGGLLTAWGLMIQRRSFYQMGMKSFGRDVSLAALAFGLYGGIGQLFASTSMLFPSVYLNADAFLRWFGFPIQVFRAVMACLAAIFIIRSLRAFEVETNRQIENLRAAQVEEKRNLEVIRSDLLHQTVKAQEAERQRIARELHDELGQTLTALGMGLQGISEIALKNPQRVSQQAAELKKLVNSGIEELQLLVTGLRPPQLDDLGLLAAIRWYASDIQERYGLNIKISGRGVATQLPDEIRIVYYRVAQEALTNIVRHAEANQVSIQLVQIYNEVTLHIEDDGKGFDVDYILQKRSDRPCWGLLGMIERAELIGGHCMIASSPGRGAIVEVVVSLPDGASL